MFCCSPQVALRRAILYANSVPSDKAGKDVI